MPEPVSGVEAWPLPAGLRRWSEHSLFTAEVLREHDWQEIEAAACRQ